MTMLRTREDVKKRKMEYLSILDGRERMRSAFQTHFDYLVQCVNDLLATYREANRLARSTPAPSHYSEQWELNRPLPVETGIAGEITVDQLERAVQRSDGIQAGRQRHQHRHRVELHFQRG